MKNVILKYFPKDVVILIDLAIKYAARESYRATEEERKSGLDNGFHRLFWSKFYTKLNTFLQSYPYSSGFWRYVSCYLEELNSIVTFIGRKKFDDIQNNPNKRNSIYQEAHIYFNKDLDIQGTIFDDTDYNKVSDYHNRLKRKFDNINIKNHILISLEYSNGNTSFLSAYILAPNSIIIEELNLLDYIQPDMDDTEGDIVPKEPLPVVTDHRPLVSIDSKYKNISKGNKD